MNEQLVVKNFGPIKDATVDFKRVTVFIGPTGGGKSTLAKLAAIFREPLYGVKPPDIEHYKADIPLVDYQMSNYVSEYSKVLFKDGDLIKQINFKNGLVHIPLQDGVLRAESFDKLDYANELTSQVTKLLNEIKTESNPDIRNDIIKNVQLLTAKAASEINHVSDKVQGIAYRAKVFYIPSERIFASSIASSLAGLMRDDIGLPKPLLNFSNQYFQARDINPFLRIHIFEVDYFRTNGQDLIVSKELFPLKLSETASGIQSVTPLLVLLEHLSRNTEQAQSFIIEEPELNLYPTAQRDLVYWLLEKCTQGDNDLTITTHSPYVLSALNLALYANKVATLFPHQHKKVAKLIPEKYWLKAEEFSAYFVAKGDAKSIFDTKTGLLSESQLDEVSGEFADVFDRLTDLRVPEKKAVAKAKPAKK